MVDSKDIGLGIFGMFLSLYGGNTEDQFLVISGVLVLILTMYFKIDKQEEDIGILQAQINTKSELNSIWREIHDIKDAKFKKR